MDQTKWPIAKITFAALLCLQIVTVGLMLLISHLWGEEAYLKHVRGLMRAVATESVQSVENLLLPAEHLIRSSRELLEADVLPTEPNTKLERYFFESIRANTNLSGMYFGWMNGDFLFVTHAEPNSGSPFMSKYILSSQEGERSSHQIFRSATFAERYRVSTEDPYDPRTRPWFNAVGGTELKWTIPYIYFTSNKPGITVSIPVLDKEGEPIGVLGLDIEITNLSYFLSKNELSPNSSALIATSDYRTVAHTDFDAIMQTDPNDPNKHRLIRIEDMQDNLVNQTLAALDASGQPFVSDDVRSVTFEYLKQTYHAIFHSYNKLGVNWTVVITAPERDFIETIRSAQRWQILMAVLCSLIVTLIAFLLALRFLRPVGELQESLLRNTLTGLYNRRALDNFGDSMVKEAHRKGRVVSMAMVDIDRFKRINDTYGHPIGDEVLVATSQRMLHALKKSDVLARYGGEEFALLMVGADLGEAKKVCERLRRVVNQAPVITKSGSIAVTVSVGVAQVSVDCDYFHDALAEADQALYMAKRTGRNRVCTVKDLDLY